jgi:hypothetical protein
MQIGLIRHFSVNLSYPKKVLLTKAEIVEWFDTYETAQTTHQEVDLRGIDWQQCFSSTSYRAVNTAEQVYNGEITRLDWLRELDVLHLLPGGIRLPFLVWGTLVFRKSISANPVTIGYRQKMADFLDELLSGGPDNVLIVSHWYVMRLLQKELLQRGFRGDSFTSAVNGKLYVFNQ